MPDSERIRDKKASIRAKMYKARSRMQKDECARLSEQICRTFLETDEYRDASIILLYKSINNEVDTDMIFEQACCDGKKVAYPVSKVVDGVPHMSFYTMTDTQRFTLGYKGIPEPDMDVFHDLIEGRADVVIMPGVAFDRKRDRIGYGRAFYDRYLELNTPYKIIGLAYDMQIIDDFEPEQSDRPVDMIITESGIIRA